MALELRTEVWNKTTLQNAVWNVRRAVRFSDKMSQGLSVTRLRRVHPL